MTKRELSNAIRGELSTVIQGVVESPDSGLEDYFKTRSKWIKIGTKRLMNLIEEVHG